MPHLERQGPQPPKGCDFSTIRSSQQPTVPAPAIKGNEAAEKINIPFTCDRHQFPFPANLVSRLEGISLQSISSYRALVAGACTEKDMAFMFGTVSLGTPKKENETPATPASNVTQIKDSWSFDFDGHLFEFPVDPIKSLCAIREQTITCYRALDLCKSTPRDMAFLFSTIKPPKLVSGGLPQASGPESNPRREKAPSVGAHNKENSAGRGENDPDRANDTSPKWTNTDTHWHHNRGGRQGSGTGEDNKRRHLSNAGIPSVGIVNLISGGDDPRSGGGAFSGLGGEPVSSDESLYWYKGGGPSRNPRDWEEILRSPPGKGQDKLIRDFSDLKTASSQTGRSQNWVKAKYVAGCLSLKGQFANSKELRPKCDMCNGKKSKLCKVLVDPNVGPVGRTNCDYCISQARICRVGGVDRREIEEEKDNTITID